MGKADYYRSLVPEVRPRYWHEWRDLIRAEDPELAEMVEEDLREGAPLAAITRALNECGYGLGDKSIKRWRDALLR